MEVLDMLGLWSSMSKSRSFSIQREEEGRCRTDSLPSKQHRVLLPREKAEPYLTGNPHVLAGFRKCESVAEAVDGLWYWHNQTFDAWTSIISIIHSAACFLFAVRSLDVFSMGVGPASVFTLFWLHVVVHAPASVSCHLIGNAGISREWYDFTLQADYLCIFLASTLLSFTLSFWVFPPLVTLGILLVAVSMTVHLAFHLKAVVGNHHQRLIMLLGIGHLYQLPLWYQGVTDWLASAPGSPLPFTLVCAMVVEASLFLGGFLYAFHLPERFAPGKFDMVNSHGIMHIMIQVAHFFEFCFLAHMCLRRQQSVEWLAY